jgi:hypothetical protein
VVTGRCGGGAVRRASARASAADGTAARRSRAGSSLRTELRLRYGAEQSVTAGAGFLAAADAVWAAIGAWPRPPLRVTLVGHSILLEGGGRGVSRRCAAAPHGAPARVARPCMEGAPSRAPNPPPRRRSGAAMANDHDDAAPPPKAAAAKDAATALRCVQRAQNAARIGRATQFDGPAFDAAEALTQLRQSAPKLLAVVAKIGELDAADRREHGTVFKHVVFSAAPPAYGAKAVVGALLAAGGARFPRRDAAVKPGSEAWESGAFGDAAAWAAAPKLPVPAGAADAVTRAVIRSGDQLLDFGREAARGRFYLRDTVRRLLHAEGADAGVNPFTQEAITAVRRGVAVVAAERGRAAAEPVAQLPGGAVHLVNVGDGRVGPSRPGATNVALLTSAPVFGEVLRVRERRALLARFNARPHNVHGADVRILVLDGTYKEGVDAFDVRYLHLVEPLLSPAHETQAMGRALRQCGQAGLPFFPGFGWPLHVFRYHLRVPRHLAAELGAASMRELQARLSADDAKAARLAAGVMAALVAAAVDAPLTKALGSSAARRGAAVQGVLRDGRASPVVADVLAAAAAASSRSPAVVDLRDSPASVVDLTMEGGAGAAAAEQPSPAAVVAAVAADAGVPPPRKLPLRELHAYVAKAFGAWAWPAPPKVDGCAQSAAGALATLKPSQEFVRRWFTPACPYKGLLLDHGVGTGKTCTAIATGSSGFEAAGYRVLYVTRSSLRGDPHKNIVRPSCHVGFAARVAAGALAPTADAFEAAYKSLAARGLWMRPLSYAQLANVLAGRGDRSLRATLRRRASKADAAAAKARGDVLYKTLLVLDEAHKLFDTDLSAAEAPDVAALRSMIHHSFAASGRRSVRVLAMTATPAVDGDPLSPIKLLNLMRPAREALPETAAPFLARFGDGATGALSDDGERELREWAAGYVSVLDRGGDASEFAQPVLWDVSVPLSANVPEAEMGKARHAVMSERIDARAARRAVAAAAAAEGAAKARISECAGSRKAATACRVAARAAARASTRTRKDAEGAAKAARRALTKAERVFAKATRKAAKSNPRAQETALRKCVRGVGRDGVRYDVGAPRGASRSSSSVDGAPPRLTPHAVARRVWSEPSARSPA